MYIGYTDEYTVHVDVCTHYNDTSALKGRVTANATMPPEKYIMSMQCMRLTEHR